MIEILSKAAAIFSMRAVGSVLIAYVTLALPLSVAADHAPSLTAARSPADMNVEERTRMMKSATHYDHCIYSEAIAKVNEFPDIRQAADFGLSTCQSRLAELEETITAMGFGADYAHAFAMRIRNRAARKILPELAVRKAGG